MLHALILSTALAWVNSPPAAMRAHPKLSVAVVTGPVDQHFSERLARLVDQNPQVRTIEIESPGGFADQAYRAAKKLNQHDISIRVRGRCASACVYLWAATNIRYLREGARLGLHAARPVRQPPGFMRGAAKRHNEALEHQALANAGFTSALIESMRAVPHDEMLWLTPSELRAAGVRFEIDTDAPRDQTVGESQSPQPESASPSGSTMPS